MSIPARYTCPHCGATFVSIRDFSMHVYRCAKLFV